MATDPRDGQTNTDNNPLEDGARSPSNKYIFKRKSNA